MANFEDLQTSGTNVVMYGFAVWDEDLSEHWDRDGLKSSATRTIVCMWDERIAFIQRLLGRGTYQIGVNDANQDPLFFFEGPDRYPDAPWMFAETVDPVGICGRNINTSQLIAYKYARLKVTYKIPDGLDLGSLSIDYGGEMLSLPTDSACFRWADGTDVPSECNPAIPITTAKLKVTVKHLASIPTDVIMSLVDKTNAATFQGGPPETVVYHGATSEKKFTTTGRENFDLTHCWTYRGVPLAGGGVGGWNHFLRPNGGGFQRVVRKDNGQPPFPPADFTPLLGG